MSDMPSAPSFYFYFLYNSGAFPRGYLPILSKFMLGAIFQPSPDSSSSTKERLKWRETLAWHGMRLRFPAEDETEEEEEEQRDPSPGRSGAEVQGEPEGTEPQRGRSSSCSPSLVTSNGDEEKEPHPVKSEECVREV